MWRRRRSPGTGGREVEVAEGGEVEEVEVEVEVVGLEVVLRAAARAVAAAAADRSLSDLGRFLVLEGEEEVEKGLLETGAPFAGGSVETLMGKRRVEDLRIWRGEKAGCDEDGTSGETGRGAAAGAVVVALSFDFSFVPAVVPMVGEPPVVDDVEAEEAVEKRREEDVVASEMGKDGRANYTPLR